MQEPRIIYEDDLLVVVDKPSGMIVYPDGVHEYPALSAWLEGKYAPLYFPHRIDRETSGVLLVARTEAVFEQLKGQFKNREVKKVYRAFLYGKLAGERGVIDKPVGSARGGAAPRSARQPHGRARDALTTYRVIGASPGATYVEAFPKTGRTHQIRAHFAALQHPVVCDPLYAPGRPSILSFERLALHALSLTLTHPATGQEVTFSAPLPADFLRAEEKIPAK